MPISNAEAVRRYKARHPDRVRKSQQLQNSKQKLAGYPNARAYREKHPERVEKVTRAFYRNHPEYRGWQAMKDRCYNPNSYRYADYGERGITVCSRWRRSFKAFLNDMGPRPSPQHSIDRKENNKGYCKSNCRWATPQEQADNRRNTTLIEGKPLSYWVSKTGLKRETIRARFNRGWPIERVVKSVDFRLAA